VPKFYASLQRASHADARVRLGFIGDEERINERTQQVNTAMTGLL